MIQIVGERNQARAFAMDAILAVSTWVAVPATLVVGVTGVYQLADGPYGLDDAWASAGLGMYLAVMAVAIAYLAPGYRRARDAARAGDDAGYRRALSGPTVVGALVAAAVVGIAVLMVVKPS